MMELFYWMLAAAPSNIFVLLMMEDLCHPDSFLRSDSFSSRFKSSAISCILFPAR